jgi:Tfp pilus assembly protein PilO
MEAAVKIKNRQNFLVMLTIAVVGLFVAVNFIFTPLQGWWSERQAQVRDLRDKVRDGNQLIKREAGIRSHWEEMRANALPATMSQAEQTFLKAMDGWSHGSGAVITSLMPQWKVDSTNYMTLDCRVETAGDLNALSKFIYNIEKGPLAVRLDSVELSSHDNNGQQMTLGLEINGLALIPHDKK